MLKKILTPIIALLCILTMATVVLGATGYSSGSTKMMNSLFGTESEKSTITVSAYKEDAVTNKVELNITVSSGSDPFYVIIESPTGEKTATYIRYSTNLVLYDFNGYDAVGKWKGIYKE